MSLEKINSILKINGLSAADSDEAIRSVLLDAHFSQQEVTEAITVLLTDTTCVNVSQVDGLHKVFRTDATLKPDEISDLLHVDVDLNPVTDVKIRRPQRFEVFHLVLIWFLSVVFALSGILFYMYINQVGLYHPSLS